MKVKQRIRPVFLVVSLSALTIVSVSFGQMLPGRGDRAGNPAAPSGTATGSLEPNRDAPVPRYGLSVRAPARLSPVPAAAGLIRAAAPASGTTPTQPPQLACTKDIDVNLSTQLLVASACGHVYISAAITSGRPSLPTPTGTFSISQKEQNVYFYSPWPQGDPNYYPPMFVAYAMEFLGGGYFMHTDPDEPEAAFGVGSENGPYASHGCVHVPYPVMVNLYAWTDDGAQVTIHY